MLRSPFFVLNPKSYLNGEELLDLALYTDSLAHEHDVDVIFTAPLIDLKSVVEACPHLIVTAQHMDGIEPGRGMGQVSVKSLKDIGVKATFLNHAEHPLEISKLTKIVQLAKKYDIMTILCADSLEEARVMSNYHPTVMLCEPTDLIGTGQTSDEEYMKQTNEVVKSVSPETLVLQAAGISTADDIIRALQLGADGSGGTSGIVCADDPKQVVKEMIQAVVNHREGK